MAPAAQVVQTKSGPGLLVRALWFLLVGWWFTGLMMALAWLAGLTVIGLPVMVYLVNRLPTFLTLRPRRQVLMAVTDASGATTWQTVSTPQYNLLLRAVYFLLVGWWLSGVVMGVAWLLCVTLILFPIGIMLINRVPFIYSLHKGYA